MEGETTPAVQSAVAPPPVELPAPNGWKKTFFPPKKGSSRRKRIVFLSPTGEEITNKQQLSKYIRTHPECPSASEFDWGIGNTPRRSARLQKSTAEEAPESESPGKRQKMASSKKEAKGKKNIFDVEDETTEENKETTGNKEAVNEETKESGDVPMEDAEDAGGHSKDNVDKDSVKDTKEEINKGEPITDEAVADKDNVNETKEKMNEDEVVKEEVPADKSNVNDAEEKTNEDVVVTEEAVADKGSMKDIMKEKVDEDEAVKEENIADTDTREKMVKKTEENKPVNEETGTTTNSMEEDAGNKSDPVLGSKKNTVEAEPELQGPEDPTCLPVAGDATTAADVADEKVVNESEDANVGQVEEGRVVEEKPDSGCVKNEEKEGKSTQYPSTSCKDTSGR
ncbi:hypothetical protein LguiB_001270 [Lonicera macranthoides]